MVIGGAEIDELIEIVEHPALALDRRRHKSVSHAADNQSVRLCHAENMIGGFPSAGAGHVLGDDCRISWNILLQERKESFDAYIAGTAGIAADDHGNRLTLIKGNLSVNGAMVDRGNWQYERQAAQESCPLHRRPSGE